MLCLSSVIFFCEIALSDLKINSFEAQVLKGLKSCKIDLKEIAASKGVLGAAVSGGADSVSLLISLSELCRLYKIPLKIITVNHNIREERETCGDVKFVEKLCETLKVQNYDISLAVYELKRGEVVSLAEKNKIKKVQIGALEICKNSVICPVTVDLTNTQITSKLTLISLHKGIDFTAKDASELKEKPVRQLKVFRLGIVADQDPHAKSISKSVWCKIS